MRALNRIILMVVQPSSVKAVDFCNTPLTLVESQDRDYTAVVPTHRDKIYPIFLKYWLVSVLNLVHSKMESLAARQFGWGLAFMILNISKFFLISALIAWHHKSENSLNLILSSRSTILNQQRCGESWHEILCRKKAICTLTICRTLRPFRNKKPKLIEGLILEKVRSYRVADAAGSSSILE